MTTSRKAALALVSLKDDSDGHASWEDKGKGYTGAGKVNTNTYYIPDVLVFVCMRVCVCECLCVRECGSQCN